MIANDNNHFLDKNRTFWLENTNFEKEEEKKLSESFVSYPEGK